MSTRVVMLYKRLLCRPLKQSWNLPNCLHGLLYQRTSLLQPKENFTSIFLQREKCVFKNARALEEPCLHQSVRYYAKSRDKKKSDKGQKKKVQVNDEILAEVIDVESLRKQMQGAIEKLKEDFIKNVSLRSSSGSLETLPITFEGKDYVLQDVAQVVRKNPKVVVINMAAFPQVIPSVMQAMSKSGMNLSPQQDGTTIYVPIAKVTKEHRESLAKNAKSLFIRCRDSIKDTQNKFIKTVKNKEKDGLSKDTAFEVTEYISYVSSEYISGAEKLLEAKQQELLKES